MRWGILVVAVAACGQPAFKQPELPTLKPSDTYHTRIANLRTTLARGGIMLRVAGQATTFETSGCDEATSHAGVCVRCDLAGEGTPMDGAVLEAATRAFARYPTDVLTQAKIAHVAVCTEIVYADDATHRPAGLADPHGHNLLISVKYFLDRTYAQGSDFTVEDIAHHEVFHLLESAAMVADRSDDPEWNLHNPLGFEYSEKLENEPRRAGFVSSYAMSAPVEDKASVFQMVMRQPDLLCEMAKTDEIIRIKTRILFRRMFRAVGTDSFMRDFAPCIDWLD